VVSIKPEPKGVQPVFRFAPSPNGELHLGHALSALLGFELGRRAGGRFLLRIEDIDPDRCRPEYEDAIYRDLAWIGLEWEEPVRRQSEHMDDYRTAIERLRQMDLVYPAFMSRAEIAAATADPSWPRDPDGAPLYPATDRGLARSETQARIAAGAAHALRIDAEKAIGLAGRLWWREEGDGLAGETGTIEAKPAAGGDFVIARRDVPTSYQLAVVVDDADQGVTHVVRGQDLLLATAAHRLLQAHLGLAAPVYHHHRIITDATGRKLSKADRATSLRALREAGATAADIRRRVGIDHVLGR
jgi:glutamyl-Q tRNA(Asp) synthetase